MNSDMIIFLEDLKNLLYDTEQNEIITEVLDLIDNQIWRNNGDRRKDRQSCCSKQTSKT